MEVSASEFARMCGVSAMAVSKKIKAGTLVRNSAKKLDTDNAINRAYLENKQSALRNKLKTRELEESVKKETDSDSVVVDAEIYDSKTSEHCNTSSFAAQPGVNTQKNLASPGCAASYPGKNIFESENKAKLMQDMTLKQLLRTFGTVDNVERYSKILRDLSTADEREQKTQERRLEQIPRDFVVQNLFGYVDQLMNQLLDVPESVCDQIVAVLTAGGDDMRVNVIHILSDNLTRCISGAKEHITNEINGLRGKYEKQDAAVDQLVSEKLEEMREIG